MLKNETLRRDADAIIRASLNAVLPDEAVRRALRDLRPGKGRVLLVAAGRRPGRWHTRRLNAGPGGWRRGRDQVRPCER